MMKDENLTPKKLKEITKGFDEFVSKHPVKRVSINHGNDPERIKALRWFMSYDFVERSQIIRLAYEMWQENQQIVLQQEAGG
jgi:hypothetical protein